MSNLAVRVESLSKKYEIGLRKDRHDTFRDQIVHGVKSFFSLNGDGTRNSERQLESSVASPKDGDHASDESFIWALKDVSFEIKQGEVVGFVGKNGAGKSTLLKILSRITEPTSGRAEIHGRVGSLLEVGTGFHAELTGRENIYLNGAIMGMKNWEIEKKFDAIVAFAEIDKFIDTPVKRYSSGMYVRLAFAVAAHLEPEILIVDEVLAVGDAQFQKKCLGKMDDVAKEGRTVLFVSHNLAALLRLCTHGLLLNEGQTVCYDSVDSCVARYEQMNLGSEVKTSAPHVVYEARGGNDDSEFQITKIEILDPEGHPKEQVFTWDSFVLRVQYNAQRSVVSNGGLVIIITTPDGTPLMHLSNQPDCAVPMDIKVGKNEIDCYIKRVPLAAGEYLIGVGLAIPYQEWLLKVKSLGRIQISPRDVFGSGLAPIATRGLLAVSHEWRIR